MASVIECDGCHQIIRGGAPYFSIERLGGNSGWTVSAMGARTEFDVCSADCLAQLAADMLEQPC